MRKLVAFALGSKINNSTRRSSSGVHRILELAVILDSTLKLLKVENYVRWKNKINQRLNHRVNKKRKYKEIQGKEEETIDSSSRKILSGCGTRFLNKGSGVVER